MISVVIPLYNKEVYIKETINCVLNQTYRNFEVVIVSDGSTDNSEEIVKSFSDSRIRLIQKSNGGVSSARNLGIKKAEYDYIAFLDADDKWAPNHLEEIYKLIVSYGKIADVFVTNFAREYPDGKIIPQRPQDNIEFGIVENYFQLLIQKGGIIHTSCVCVAKHALKNVGLFNIKISRGEDMDLWFRLARKFKIAYSPMVTEYYLQEAENSCAFTLPDPEKIYAYYFHKDDVVNQYDLKIHKRLIRKRFLRYVILDRNIKFAFKFLVRQYKNLI